MTTKDIKYWLEESDLKTPEHDKIVLWAFENTEEILKKLDILPQVRQQRFSNNEVSSNPYGDWDWEIHQYIKRRVLNEYETEQFEIIKLGTIADWKKFNEERDNKKEEYSIEKVIEYALGGQYNIGFLDLCIKIKPRPIHCGPFSEVYNNILEGGYENDYKNLYFFEIKPEIKSIGEVMRQISYYRKYLPANHYFILITKTKGLKDLFKTQNIFVYEYETEIKKDGV